ncbi:pectate lyase, partial [Streptomyces pharetrae]
MHRSGTLLLTALAALSVTAVAPAPVPAAPAVLAESAPTGFASVDAWGQNGTTGGAGGATVTVSTASDLSAAIRAEGPRTVRVNGMIALPAGMYDVSSDKTIVGVGAA